MTKYPTIEEGFMAAAMRMAFYEERDGKEEALRVANRDLCTDHICMANPDHFARLKEYRGMYIGSICFLEQYVGDVVFPVNMTALPSVTTELLITTIDEHSPDTK